jgi:vacuolar iron transporter family protein
VLGGIAELIAGAISMGIGGFLASQAERDYYRYQRKSTAARVKRSCNGEIEREVAQVLGPVGVDEKICSTVAKSLLTLELESEGRESDSRPPSVEDGGLKWSKDVGVTAFLIKFGEGLGASDSLD